jgi:molybdopterin synthase catalytic subunit
MKLSKMIQKIKQNPDYHNAGMILCHNGVVRNTSRDGRKVTGLSVQVDHKKLETILEENKKRPGIIDILIEIFDNRFLSVGDDVMYLLVAGDIRENVIETLSNTLNAVKTTVTQKTETYETPRHGKGG